MDKISVIIPTIQKNVKVLRKLVDLLSEDIVVDEILVINNIDKAIKFDSYKVNVLQQEKNLYVNASWNLGIGLIKNNKFLIINDDILPCANFCSIINASGILDDENTGLVGIGNKYINQKPRDTEALEVPVAEGKVFYEKLVSPFNTGDWGSAFFGRRESYFMIPNDIRIIYGDNYLLYKNNRYNRENYSICGLPFNHIHSLSSASPEFHEIVRNDIINQKKHFV